ncbi:MAG: hypothetical protein ILO68_02255 [Clostridia bacterium]|nr:hypothetical protein [Clostridia bacterium]
MKRLLAIVLTIVVMLSLVACGKPEKGKQASKYGFKKYSVDPNNESDRKLVEEYENLGTERTQTIYDELTGDVTEVNKWYYDNAGEVLMKEVRWRKGNPTTSLEYDEKGRCIVVMSKIEHADIMNAETGALALTLPSEYLYNCPHILDMTLYRLAPLYYITLDDMITEIRTEYTYRGDMEEIQSIRTTTNTGETVAELVYGEGDIVLKGRFVGEIYLYEETYDPDTRTGRWMVKRHGESYDYFGGEKKYDQQGRCIYAYKEDDNMEEWFTVFEFVYEPDGYWENVSKGRHTDTAELRERNKYDSEGRFVCYELYYTPDSGETILTYRSTREFLDDGRIACAREEYWDRSGNSRYEDNETTTYEYTDSDDGAVCRVYQERYDKRFQESEERKTVMEVSGIIGQVSRIESTSFNSVGEVTAYSEYYRLNLPDRYVRTEESMVEYSGKNVVSGETNEEITSEFDKQGHLRKVEEYDIESGRRYGYDGPVYRCDEYNAGGMLCRSYKKEGDEETLFIWEHWEK